MKGSEKINKYLNLARELKKLWNMKVIEIPIVVHIIMIPSVGQCVKGLSEYPMMVITIEFLPSIVRYDNFYIYQEVQLNTYVVSDFKQPEICCRNRYATALRLYNEGDNNSFQP